MAEQGTRRTLNIAVDKPSTGQYHILDAQPDRAYRLSVTSSTLVGSQYAPFVVTASAEIWRCGTGRFDRWHNAGAVVAYPGVTRLYLDISGYSAGILLLETWEEPLCGCGRRVLLEHTQFIAASVAPVPINPAPSGEYALSDATVIVTGATTASVSVPPWQPIPLSDTVTYASVGGPALFTTFTRMP